MDLRQLIDVYRDTTKQWQKMKETNGSKGCNRPFENSDLRMVNSIFNFIIHWLNV